MTTIFTPSQIERAKIKYADFLKIETADNYEVSVIGRNDAENRAEFHNREVNAILNGNKELEAKWKMFFLREEAKSDFKKQESLAKKNANKEASADILAPIKSLKKIVDFGKWLNTPNNPFRKQHFSKKYTSEAVEAFLKTI